MAEISNTDDTIDVRAVITRFAELRELRDDPQEGHGLDEDDAEELRVLTNLLDELRGNGGDHQWEGDWYPTTLIREEHFEDFAQQYAEEIGAIPEDAQWPATCIDWAKAAEELRVDYTSADFDGNTYWFR